MAWATMTEMLRPGEQLVPGTNSMVGQHMVAIIEQRRGPFGLVHHYVVRASLINYLTIEERVVGQRLETELEARFRKLEVADRAHTAVIEGLMRGGVEAAKERMREFR